MDASDYVKHRPLMFSIAYRMTGSVSDAEDIVQEAEGCVVNVFALDIADGLVQVVRSVANPGKLRHLDPTSDLALASGRI